MWLSFHHADPRRCDRRKIERTRPITGMMMILLRDNKGHDGPEIACQENMFDNSFFSFALLVIFWFANHFFFLLRRQRQPAKRRRKNAQYLHTLGIWDKTKKVRHFQFLCDFEANLQKSLDLANQKRNSLLMLTHRCSNHEYDRICTNCKQKYGYLLPLVWAR